MPLAILISTRLFPFLKWPGVIPLGADAGIYLYNFQTTLQGKYTIISDLLKLFFWPTTATVFDFYIIINIIIGLMVYLITKEYFGKQAAFFSFLIFALSVPQYLAYFAFYWQMMIALCLTLTILYLIKKQSWLIIPLGGFLGGIHAVSLIPLSITMLIYLFFAENKKFIFFSGLGIAVVYLLISWQEFFSWLPTYLIENHGLVNENYSLIIKETLKGHFIDWHTYFNLVIVYFPLAIIGFMQSLKVKNCGVIVAYLLTNSILIYFNFIFYNRFIIPLDISLIIFAGLAVASLVNKVYFSPLGKIALSLLFIFLFIFNSYHVWHTRPFITDTSEIEEIKSLSQLPPDTEIITINGFYYPYLLAFSQLPRLQIKNINIETDNGLVGILEKYDYPVYIYTGKKLKNLVNIDLDKHYFLQISDNVWLFKPNITY